MRTLGGKVILKELVVQVERAKDVREEENNPLCASSRRCRLGDIGLEARNLNSLTDGFAGVLDSLHAAVAYRTSQNGR